MRYAAIIFNTIDIVKLPKDIKIIIDFSQSSEVINYCFDNKIIYCYINRNLPYFREIIYQKLNYNNIDFVFIDNDILKLNIDIKKSPIR